jgi:hypothetical protein
VARIMARIHTGENKPNHFWVFRILIFPLLFYIWDLLPVISAHPFRNASGFPHLLCLRSTAEDIIFTPGKRAGLLS